MKSKAQSTSYGTLKQYKALLSKIIDFGKISTMSDVTYNNIYDFDRYLRQIRLQETTICKIHTIFKAVINEGVRKDVITSNPYNKFKFARGKYKDPTFLSRSEVQKIIDWSPNNDKMRAVRDLFLFQCHTGMAYVDMCQFDKSCIDEVSGHEIIRSYRKKTDERFVIPILPKTKEILEYYNYQLPVISNQKYNDFLKVLAEHCNIDKHLTTHVGRHTFAMTMLNSGVNIESISAAMGHVDPTVTRRYAKMLAETTINDILDKVGGK